MDKITIRNAQGHSAVLHENGSNDIVVDAQSLADVSDGYHTIAELYDHRITLYIALCRMLDTDGAGYRHVWRTKVHFDGSSYEGWFMLAINTEAGKQISYHIPLSRWDETDFAETFDKAPVEFDGHTSSDVIERLKNL